jgi:hypothetical protein
MPEYVVDYVLLHELVHLLVSDHGPAFEAWMAHCPRLDEARAFLAGVDHATGHGLGSDPDRPDDAVGDGGPTPSAASEPARVHAAPAPRRRPVTPPPGTDPLF